jgi:parallel beta-helix repeat protein
MSVPRHGIRLITVSLIIQSAILAGDLNPPGAPASTPGPEPRIAVNADNTPGDADSVYRIISPGSYYLTGNVLVGSDRNGIEIGSSDVTLDLNGFAVRRARLQVGQPPPKIGILADQSLSNITVRDGSISGMGQTGMEMALEESLRVENVLSEGNGEHGFILGHGAVVSHCVAAGNGLNGIEISEDSIVSDCVARQNGRHGILLFGDGTLVTGNVCNGNGVNETGAGIDSTTVNTCRVEGNTVSHNDIGISIAGNGNVIIRNTAIFNTTNYSISGSNAVGPIVNGTNPITTTNPWANFQM